MKNYTSVNAKYYQSNELIRIINHNLRSEEIEYLLDKEYIKWENKNFLFGLENNSNNIDLNDITKTKFKNMFFKNFVKMCQQRDQQNQKKGYYNGTNKNDLIEMVISLSEEQTLFYLQNGQKDLIDMAYKQLGQEIKNKYGFEPLMASMHYDEGHIQTTKKIKDNIENIEFDVNNMSSEQIETIKKEKYNFHCQITFFNYDFKNSRSVLRTMKKQDWRDIQDLAQNTFKAFGLNYKRGVSKGITGKEHLDNLEYKIQELEKENLNLQFENKNLSKNNDFLYSENKDLSFKNDSLKEIINLKNLEIIEKSDQINGLIELSDKTKEELKDTIKEKEKAIKEVASVKNELKDTLNELDKVKNDLTKTRSERDNAQKELNLNKQKLSQVIKIEQKLRKDTRQKKEFLLNYEKKVKEVQVLEKDKTTNLSQKIDKIKDIYLKNAPIFGVFKNDQFHEDMMNEFGDILSVNYNNKTLKEENKDLKFENKQLKNLDVVEIKKENKELKEEVKEKDKIISNKKEDIVYYVGKFKEVDSENTKLKDKIYDLENKDKTKNKNFQHIGD